MGIHKKVMKIVKSILLGLVSMATANRIARAGHGDHGEGEHEVIEHHSDTNSTMGGNMTDHMGPDHHEFTTHSYGEEVAEHEDDHHKEDGHHNDHQDWEYMDNYWDEIASGAL